MQLTGSQTLMECLLHEGVEHLFVYPGGSIIPVFDSMYDYTDRLHPVLVRHEQGATHAAEGYARISGKPGVVILTSGPGATNAITGIADALMDSTPMVVIAGQVGTAVLGTDAFQETDFVCITQPISKWSYQIRSAEEIPWAVARAFYIAQTGRPGPVVLDFTKTAQTQVEEYQPTTCQFIRSYLPTLSPDTDALQQAAELINAAQKPFALVGHGVTLAQAETELRILLEKADIPAGWTMLGKSALPYNHPLNMGMVGMHGNVAPNLKTNECDVLLAIGMRFDDRVTGCLETYAKQAQIIHLEIDPSEIDKNVRSAVALLGNVKETLPALCQRIQPAQHSAWIASFQAYQAQEQTTVVQHDLHPEASHPITMAEVVRKISDATQQNAILVTDVGQHQMSAIRYFQSYPPRSLATSGGLGTMGYGIPAAIGAKIAAPERTVCLFCGDGGFQMTVQELGTILQEHLGVKMIILNNSYLGMVRQWQELFYHKRYSSTPLVNPDFETLAKAYQIASQRVSQRSELDGAVERMLANDEAFLLIVDVEKEGMIYPMIPAGGSVTDVLMGNEH